MDLGKMVDVAIGLSLMFLMLSLFCTLINEMVVGHLAKLRSRFLKDGLLALAGDCTKFWEVLGHPMIAAAGPGKEVIAAQAVAASTAKTLSDAEAAFAAAGDALGRATAERDGNLDPQKADTLAAAVVAATQAMDAARKTMEDAQPPAGKAGIAFKAALEVAGKVKGKGPAYLTGQAFASAVLDVVNPNFQIDESATCKAIQDGITALPPGRLQDVLRAAVNNGAAGLQNMRDSIAQFFDEEMTRLEGAYKRWLQAISFAIGLALAVSMNADAIQVARTLWRDHDLAAKIADKAAGIMEGEQGKALSGFMDAEKVVSAEAGKLAALNAARDEAKRAAEAAPGDPAKATALADAETKAKDAAISLDGKIADRDRLAKGAQGNLSAMKAVLAPLPIGWRDWGQVTCWGRGLVPWGQSCKDGPDSGTALIQMLGWLLTAMALTLGAPFWFDMLNKVVNLRSAGTKPLTTAQAHAAEQGGK